ncbi:MAG: flagellar protein FlgN [Candidatus Nitronauta litoralis]|uniref:Flagellar protein FlgN n=1 Tax=Candidatus Nitronauta litoralis TaxID=2705533 RepID=A0A7T0FZ10_9BACT|nr:MAG: flagellar protein FlgN [Candidatus Nitronauta litoralis]
MEIIFENLKQQKNCYQQLLIHLGEQQEAVANQDDEGLMNAIKKKNEYVQALHKLEQEMNTRLDQMGDSEREKVARETETLRGEIVLSIEKLIAGEEESRKAIAQQRDELEDQIKQFKKTKNLFKGYQDPSSSKGGGFKGNA